MNKYISFLLLAAVAILVGADAAFAADEVASNLYSPIGKGLAIGIAALGGGLAQGKLVASALESIGRNPGASGSIFTPMILGLVFVETLVILAFVIALNA